MSLFWFFFFSSRRRHTRCALVTGVQTCALPIYRVSLAEPQVPEDVQRQGIEVSKKSSALLQLVALYSPDNSHDAVYLTNFGIINVIDTLARIPGVGQAQLYGLQNYSMRIWFQTDVLTSLGLTPTDVVNAIQRSEEH